jgi:hypothetical protein
MDVKKKIKNEVDTLVVTVAGAYNELIVGDIPDADIDRTVDAVSKAKDYAEGNLIKIAEIVVDETIAAVHQQTEAKAARLKSLIPTDVIITSESQRYEIAPAAKEIPVAPILPNALEGPVAPLPRDVGGVSEPIGPPNIEHLVEQANQAMSGMSTNIGGAGLVDVDMSVPVRHDLTTAANESRIAQGLPPKHAGQGPVIHVTGQSNVKTPVVSTPPAPKVEVKDYSKEMRQIGRLVANYTENDGEIAMLAKLVLAIVEEATGENFTERPETNDAK